MANVTYIDSGILGELAAFRKRDLSRSIRVTGANENVLRILRLVNFDRFFDLTE
jgi:anti-anti-sigma regulatory factor